MAVGRAPDQPLAPDTTALASMHIGLGPVRRLARTTGSRRLTVDKDQAFGVKAMLINLPPRARRCDVGPGLLVGQQGFFEDNFMALEKPPERVDAALGSALIA